LRLIITPSKRDEEKENYIDLISGLRDDRDILCPILIYDEQLDEESLNERIDLYEVTANV